MPGIYERTRSPSRYVPFRSGPPAANCRNTRGVNRGSENESDESESEHLGSIPLSPYFLYVHSYLHIQALRHTKSDK